MAEVPVAIFFFVAGGAAQLTIVLVPESCQIVTLVSMTELRICSSAVVAVLCLVSPLQSLPLLLCLHSLSHRLLLSGRPSLAGLLCDLGLPAHCCCLVSQASRETYLSLACVRKKHAIWVLWWCPFCAQQPSQNT